MLYRQERSQSRAQIASMLRWFWLWLERVSYEVKEIDSK